MAKAKRTAAQKRATAKLIAFNKARRGGKTRSRNPSKRKASKPEHITIVNPPKRRRAVTSKKAASAAGRTLRYRRKNPTGGLGGFFKDTMIPSAIGGVGALTLDVLLGVLPLPPAFKAGPMAPVVKVAGAVGVGMLAGMVASRKTANQIAAGALTVTLYNLTKGLLIKASGGKIPGLSAYDDAGVSEYISEYVSGDDDMPQVGYVDSGMQVGELMPDGSVEGYETGVYR